MRVPSVAGYLALFALSASLAICVAARQEASGDRIRVVPNEATNRADITIDGYDAYKTWLTNQAEPGPHGKGSGDHYANFIDCVRSRRAQDIHSPIEEAHISTTLVHLANASYRLGRALRFDSAQEQVIGDEEANRLLRGSYRAPYIVPEEI